jgi:hypothetical protein
MAFGTGAVKVTPAHDPNDNACGKRNNLETAIIFTGEGKMTDNCGQFAGASLVPHSPPPLTSAARDDEVRRSYRHRGSPLGSGFASREGAEQDETRSLLEIRRHHRADDHSTVVLSLPLPLNPPRFSPEEGTWTATRWQPMPSLPSETESSRSSPTSTRPPGTAGSRTFGEFPLCCSAL